MAIIKCPECGHEISDKAPFCPSCGVAIAGKITICPKCGKVYFSDMPKCPQCQHDTCCIQPEGTCDLHEKKSEEKDVEKVNSNKTEVNTTSNGVKENIECSSEPEQSAHSNKPSNNNKIIVLVGVIIAVIVIGVCYIFYQNTLSEREENAYEYAMSSNDKHVLQDYLDNYLNAPEEHRDSIEAHLEMLKQIDQDWTNAIVSGSKSALEEYIAQHQNSPFKAIAIHKIDSIDWVDSKRQNTVEAFEAYIEQHPDGEHVEDANNAIDAMNSKIVQPTERQLVVSTVNTFFNSISNRDETALANVCNPLLSKFLGKQNATRSDVVTFMNKIYKADVSSMNWQSVGDYNIAKKSVVDNEFEYVVNFTAIQSITNIDNSANDVKYKINATINNDGKITEFNMVKILN